jgi:hypothetical protein
MTAIEIGRLLRASISGCVVGCRVSQLTVPAFGSLVRIPLDQAGSQVYGLIYDIHIDDDGLVRQLVTAEGVAEEVILDNRVNRNVPVEISVIFTGYTQGEAVYHLLPPRPPLTLDAMYLCSEQEVIRFVQARRFGYFRHILRANDLPYGELLAAHLQQAAAAQRAAGDTAWARAAAQEIITLLRDDYPTLMSVLGALSDIPLELETGQ